MGQQTVPSFPCFHAIHIETGSSSTDIAKSAPARPMTSFPGGGSTYPAADMLCV